MKLAVYCAGGLGKEIYTFACSFNYWESIFFVDDVTDAVECCGAPIYRFEAISPADQDLEFIVANGEPAVRKTLYDKLKAAGFRLATLISPYAYVPSDVSIGEGCIICDCMLSNDMTIGENVLIGTKAVLGHDVCVGAHSVVSASCFVGGQTVLEEQVYMAPGAMAKDRITVGASAIISLGAVLLRNVRPNAIMVGNPAHRLGDNAQNQVFGRFDE